MTSRWLFALGQVTRRVWFRATLFSLLAVATALAAVVASPFIPDDLPARIGSDAVDHILGIIASSMLTVTTFSLTTMVSAYSAATTNVTPRATRLVIEDRTTHNVLSTFIGSFLFSLVGIVALSTGIYGERGRAVLFAVTILVIAAIVVTLLRWIDHLSSLGRVTQTTERVEEAAARALRARREHPFLGGQPLLDPPREVPRTARAVFASRIGYVQHVDIALLSQAAADGGRIYVLAIPGDFADPHRPIARIDGIGGEDAARRVRDAFSVGDTRSFDQDPRFGACVLAEIASRALSPGINDPGTAIDVIGRAVRLLAEWGEPREREPGVEHPNVSVPPIRIGDLFDDVFTPIGRDGAATVEVGVRLQKAFRTLARFPAEGYRDSARRHSAEALERAEAALRIEGDKRRLRALAAQVGSAEDHPG